MVPADDTNMSAVYRITANNGKALISHSISEKLTYLFQNGEEGVSIDTRQASFIGEESQPSSNKLHSANKAILGKGCLGPVRRSTCLGI